MFPETLESDRLTFGRLSRENVDVLALYEVFGANHDVDRVFEYVDSNPHKTVKETFDMVRRAEDRFEDGEGAQYVVRPKTTENRGGEIAGIAGLYPKWDRRFATLGIVLDEPFWGNGYSTERAELFIEIIFERLDLELVAVKYIDGNERSKRAIEKYIERFGGQYDGLLRNWLAVEGEVFDCHRYTISREQYERSKNER
jgi:ribosomal-protein-alanine N-acetyltransferase